VVAVRNPTLPKLTSQGLELDTSAESFGLLRSSMDVLEDTAVLRERVAEDGYLYLPGYLDRNLVLRARENLMRVYAEQSVPDDLLNAARVDGAGELRIFWSVALRVLMPGFVTVLLLSFVATWNNYFLPLVVVSTPELYPLSVGLVSWNQMTSAGGGAQPLYPLVITGVLVSVIPLMITFLFLQRYWQGGLTFDSLKD
jgi:Binding-protein-dependent transport system inner membrane component